MLVYILNYKVEEVVYKNIRIKNIERKKVIEQAILKWRVFGGGKTF